MAMFSSQKRFILSILNSKHSVEFWLKLKDCLLCISWVRGKRKYYLAVRLLLCRTPIKHTKNLKAKQLTQQAINVRVNMCWQYKHTYGVLGQQGTAFKQILVIGISFCQQVQKLLTLMEVLDSMLVHLEPGHSSIVV